MENLTLFLLCKLHKANCYHVGYTPFCVKEIYTTFSKFDLSNIILKYEDKFKNALSEDIYIYVINELNSVVIACSKNQESYIFSLQLEGKVTKESIHNLAELFYLEIYSAYKSSFILVDTLNFDREAIKEKVFKKTYEQSLHHNPNFEKYLLRVVQKGDANEALDYLDELIKLPLNASLAKNSDRHYKNLLISFVTIITRATIDGGPYSENAYILSDNTIEKIEKQTRLNSDKAYQLAREIILEFIQLLMTKKRSRHSGYVNQTIQYIQKNTQNKIKVSTIADLLDITPNYLATLFKKETGMTILAYSQNEKIKEAIYLIENTTILLSEIGSILSFTDQSHFIKVFKKIKNQTPKDYQRRSKKV